MAEVKIAADSGGGSVALKGPASTTGNNPVSLKLPVADGSAGQYLKTDGSGQLSFNPGKPNILEQFFSPCDGSVIAASAGNITLSDVTAQQALTTSYADITGSSITYTPPSGTTQVIYEFHYYVANADDNAIHHRKLFLDSDEVTKNRFSYKGPSLYDGDTIVVKWGFNIGGNADTTVGRVASWSSGKTIKLQAREYTSNYETAFHQTSSWDGGSGNHLTIPSIGITAIG